MAHCFEGTPEEYDRWIKQIQPMIDAGATIAASPTPNRHTRDKPEPAGHYMIAKTSEKRVWVTDLKSALDAYWAAHSFREQQAAYHEILLFGGKDGYTNDPRWRAAIVRALRLFAHWIETR